MRTTCLFLTTAILGGCVGSIESKEAKVKVAELTSGELDALCTWLEDTTEQEKPDGAEMCELAAVETAADAIACTIYRDDCVNALPQAGVYHPGEVCAKKKKTAPKRCTATVQQLKACVASRQQEIFTAAAVASCWDQDNSRLTGSKLVSCIHVLPDCEGFLPKHASYEVESSPVTDDDGWDDDPFGDDDYASDDDDYASDDDEAAEPTDEEPADEEPADEEPSGEAPADAGAPGKTTTGGGSMTSHMDGGTH